jgi:CDGSH-type Zn-finger protein
MNPMAKAQIQVNDNGPLRVSGEVELVDAEGKVFATKPVFYLCRCGKSGNKPFCDGTHKKEGFQSAVRVEERE